jgi:hypothetical protein
LDLNVVDVRASFLMRSRQKTGAAHEQARGSSVKKSAI